MAEYYSIEPKENTTFSLDKNLYDDLTNYANELNLNKSEAINEILFNFFKSKTLTNTYLTNKAGLQFKIPMDLDIKKDCISNRTVLNVDNSNIGDDTALMTVKQIPNNLDIFTLSDDNTARSYKANKEGVLHCGVDFIFIPEVIKKPTTLSYNKLDIDLIESLYIFYFEVKADNTTDVILINPVEAINKLSDVNNRIVADKLAEMVQLLEVEEKQINYEYKTTMENLHKGNKPISNKRSWQVLDNHFTILEMDLLKNNHIIEYTFRNDNITIATIENR